MAAREGLGGLSVRESEAPRTEWSAPAVSPGATHHGAVPVVDLGFLPAGCEAVVVAAEPRVFSEWGEGRHVERVTKLGCYRWEEARRTRMYERRATGNAGRSRGPRQPPAARACNWRGPRPLGGRAPRTRRPPGRCCPRRTGRRRSGGRWPGSPRRPGRPRVARACALHAPPTAPRRGAARP